MIEDNLNRETNHKPLSISPGAARVLLAGMIILAGFFYWIHLLEIGDANTYYTAAVKSMLQSPANFFFAAAEPGGSVTVDKPPLGLWIEALFAAVLGVNGVAVVLPNIIASLLTIPLLYHLVKKPFGDEAGLAAAFVFVVSPVVVATSRNNTMDGMLTFTLVLAAWMFSRAVEKDQVRWLWLGALFIGLGFNIKMLQAFLPLPAMFGFYWFASPRRWKRKLLYLGIAAVLILVVSLAWAVVVDSFPPDERPYIGSSTNNTVMELIVGHNGLNRLLGGNGNRAQNIFPGGSGQPTGDGALPSTPTPYNPSGSAVRFSQETGQPGPGRFFSAPLGKEISWLLPLALLGIFLGVCGEKITLPLTSPVHQYLVLWGGWLLTCLVFFSAAGFFHAYYMIMLAPPMGAVLGISLYMFRKIFIHQPGRGAIFLVLAAGLTIAFQFFLAFQFETWMWWMILPVVMFLAGAGLYLAQKETANLAWTMILGAVVIFPLAWSGLTALSRENVNLPAAYAGEERQEQPRPGGNPISARPMEEQLEGLARFLEQNTADTFYLAAVPNARIGSLLVLDTGRPVYYMGGFSGNDPVMTVQDLAGMVEEGDLRYVVGGTTREMMDWLEGHCVVAFPGDEGQPKIRRPGQREGIGPVFDCGS